MVKYHGLQTSVQTGMLIVSSIKIQSSSSVRKTCMDDLFHSFITLNDHFIMDLRTYILESHLLLHLQQDIHLH